MVENKMNKNKIIYAVSFFSGFLSIAQEIIWMRLISFVGMSVPQTFSYTLALFLIGIASGAHIGKKICQKNKNIKIDFLGQIFIFAAIVDLLLLGGIYLFSQFLDLSILILGICVFCCAVVRGIVFPVVHHVGTHAVKTGAQISNVYFCNVFGSALAPLLISFIALSFLNSQQTYLLVCLITCSIGIICINLRKYQYLATVLLGFIIFLMFQPERIFHELSKNSYLPNLYPSEILENKHGIIQIYDDHDDQIVFGANVYDGKFNTNIFHNTNGIDRAYLLTALQPKAEHILVIGLSTGSWAKVLSYLPHAKKITIIEINPAYISMIKKNPTVQDLLKDDRVEIIVDDGRKWLKKSEQKNFDIILINTTWHWRAYGSSLLSQDFLKIIKNKLDDNGVFLYNTTQSIDAYETANSIFPEVYKYKFMVLALFKPLDFKESKISKNLCQLKNHVNKQMVFKNNLECDAAAKIIIQQDLVNYNQLDLSKFTTRKPEIITDNNMIVEYKYGKGL